MFQKICIFLLCSLILSGCFGSRKEENKIIENKTILTLGDSLTAGYGVEDNENYPSKLEAKLIESGYDISIINAGISGDTSQDLLNRAGEYLDINPDIVVIVIGGNDGLKGSSVIDMQKNIEDIISLYQSRNIKVVLGGMDILPIHGLGYRSDFKDVYKNISKEDSEIYFFKSFLSGVAGGAELNLQDNIHPNADGYDIITENMYDFLVKNKLVVK